jgi:predicted amidohydrolase
MKIFTCLLYVTALAGAPLPVRESGFTAGPDGKPSGWTTWSARPETAPRCFVDSLHYRTRSGSLAIAGDSNLAEHGGWHRAVAGIQPGAWYRLTAWYRTEGVAHESLQVLARIDWRDAKSQRAGQPDYAWQTRREGAWTRLVLDAPSPELASSAVLQFYLSNTPQGTVWWDDIAFEPIAAPPPRPVSIASINLRPRNSASSAESVQQFIAAIDREVRGQTDVILLPEGITVVGTKLTYAAAAEPVPGPTTGRLGEVARRHHSYLVAGLYEREDRVVYNTAVLLDRDGRLAGKYRKVYLPREEVERGIAPGRDYPVFRTDFGTVGLMICYDVFFPDPARALASRGAEMILMPIWGGDLTLGKARAIENKVFLIASGYDYPTYVMDPDGHVLALASADGTAATASIDLARRYCDRWLGDMRARRMRELRIDVPPPVPGLEP